MDLNISNERTTYGNSAVVFEPNPHSNTEIKLLKSSGKKTQEVTSSEKATYTNCECEKSTQIIETSF